MSDISNQLIKDSYNYVLQSDLATGIVYRIGGVIPINPIFQSAITVNSGFTYTNGTEQLGYVLTCDALGNANWSPISATTPSSGVTSIITGFGLSGNSTTGAVTIINTLPDQTVTITGGTNIEITGIYPNFGVNFTGSTSYITSAYTVGDGVSDISGVTGGDIALKSFSGVNINIIDSGDKLTFSGYPQQNVAGFYLPLSGGTVTGGTIFQNGVTANTISATTYQNLPSSFQSVRINGTTQFSANTGNFINFIGTNITIQSAGTNTLNFIVTEPTIPPTTTLIASGSFRYSSNGNFYYGASSSLGWNNATWNLSTGSFPSSINPSEINNLIPIPKELSSGDEITICGVVYLNGADSRHSLDVKLGLTDCTTITDGGVGDPIDITQISDFRGQSFSDNGFCCFTGTLELTKSLSLCENFLLLVIQDDRANSNIASVTFTLSCKSY
jgi:hypothetical protein